MAKVQKDSLLKDGDFDVKEVIELSFFDLTGDKAKTKGTSNKSYHAELQISKKDSKAQVYSMWGPTGGCQTRDWRHYDSHEAAKKDFDKIIKSKKKKGYVEVDVAQRAYGSNEAKKITKAVVLTGGDDLKKDIPKSALPDATQELLHNLFGSTAQFVATTLKCPLGQLTNAQIDKGREYLNDAKKIVNKKRVTKNDNEKIVDLTNLFYAAIPHNLGTGSRGQMSHLLLDDLNKIMGKEDDLDTLLDAKSVGAALNVDAQVDAQYKELNADLEWLDHSSDEFRFLSEYFSKSKVRHHGYESAYVKNIWKVERKDKERDYFMSNAERIASECGRHVFVKETTWLNKEVNKWTPAKRPDLDGKTRSLYNDANVWICWHGTRSANVVGITKRGLLVRPAGAVHTGSMYGDGKYFAWQSTKSLNYTDGGYWTGGRRAGSSRFMFGLDVALGEMHVAPRSRFYRKPPAGCHSVYGKARSSGVLNDEMITYDFDQKETQSFIRYLFEIAD
jgi:poly [ADP-ribose] polymerase